ncbi:Vacuolar protein sorting-associated protein 13 VPS13 adaptor binding domain-containing protein [Entamoeba marina]
MRRFNFNIKFHTQHVKLKFNDVKFDINNVYLHQTSNTFKTTIQSVLVIEESKTNTLQAVQIPFDMKYENAFELQVQTNNTIDLHGTINSPYIQISPIHINMLIKYITLLKPYVKDIYSLLKPLISNMVFRIPQINCLVNVELFLKDWKIALLNKSLQELFVFKGFLSLTLQYLLGISSFRLAMMNYNIESHNHIITGAPSLMDHTTTIVIVNKNNENKKFDVEIINDRLEFVLTSSDIADLLYLKDIYSQSYEESVIEMYEIELYSITKDIKKQWYFGINDMINSFELRFNLILYINQDIQCDNDWGTCPVLKLTSDVMFGKKEDWFGEGTLQISNYSLEKEEWFFTIEPFDFSFSMIKQKPIIQINEILVNIIPSLIFGLHQFYSSCYIYPPYDTKPYVESQQLLFHNKTPIKCTIKGLQQLNEIVVDGFNEVKIPYTQNIILLFDIFDALELQLKTGIVQLKKNTSPLCLLYVIYNSSSLVIQSCVSYYNHTSIPLSLTFDVENVENLIIIIKRKTKSNVTLKSFSSQSISFVPSDIKITIINTSNGYDTLPFKSFILKVTSYEYLFDVNEYIKAKIAIVDGITVLNFWVCCYMRSNAIIPIQINGDYIRNDKMLHPCVFGKLQLESGSFELNENTDLYEFDVNTVIKYHFIGSLYTQTMQIYNTNGCYDIPPFANSYIFTIQHKYTLQNNTNLTFNYKCKDVTSDFYPHTSVPIPYYRVILGYQDIKTEIKLNQSLTTDIYFGGIVRITIQQNGGTYTLTLNGCKSPLMRIENEIDFPLIKRLFTINGVDVSPYKLNKRRIEINNKKYVIEFKLDSGIVMKIVNDYEYEEPQMNQIELIIKVIGISIFDKAIKEIIFVSVYGLHLLGGIGDEIGFELYGDYLQVDSCWDGNTNNFAVLYPNQNKNVWMYESTQHMFHIGGSFIPSFNTALVYVKFFTLFVQPLNFATDTAFLSKAISLKNEYKVQSTTSKKSNPLTVIVDYLKINSFDIDMKIDAKGVPIRVSASSMSMLNKICTIRGVGVQLDLNPFEVNEREMTLPLLSSTYNNSIRDQLGATNIMALLFGRKINKEVTHENAFVFRLPKSRSLEGSKIFPSGIIDSRKKVPIDYIGNSGIKIFQFDNFNDVASFVNAQHLLNHLFYLIIIMNGFVITQINVIFFDPISYVKGMTSAGVSVFVIWIEDQITKLAYIKRSYGCNEVKIVWKINGNEITSIKQDKNGINFYAKRIIY